MKKLIIFYDNWCPNCTRFNKIVKKLDWFNLIDSKQLRNNQDIKQFKNLNLELATQQMASYTNNWNYGFVSIFFILSRLPIFCIFIPILFILKITGFGQFLYKELAIKRKIIPLHCDENSCII
jgi:predicted DCC family thiol-disulfide oxidoreductase YuxK